VVTIVGKALEFEPARRYGSAAALAADLRRYLGYQPIAARPPSRFYRAARFARRHRTLTFASAATLLVLLAATLISTHFALNARAEQRESRWQTYRAAVGAAAATLESAVPEITAGHLDQAPQELRGWEWRHLLARNAPLYRALVPSEGRKTELAVGALLDLVTFTVHEGEDAQIRVFEAGSGRMLWQRSMAPWFPIGEVFTTGDTELLLLARRVQTEATSEDLAGWPATLLTLDAQSGELQRQLPLAGRCTGGELSPDGRRVVLMEGAKARALIYDTTDGSLVRRIENITLESYPMNLGPAGKVFSAQDSADLTFKLVDVDSGELLHRGAQRFFFAPTGTRLATFGGSSSLHVLDLADGMRKLYDLPYAGVQAALAFSQDGTRLASWQQDGALGGWDLARGKQLGLRGMHSGLLTQIAILADGRHLVTSGAEHPVHVWPLEREAARLVGHRSFVYAARVSPDGRRVASGGWDGFASEPGALRIWDLDSRRELASWGEAGEQVLALDWLGDDVVVGVQIVGRSRVVRLRTDGGEVWRHALTGVEHIETEPAGTRILVASNSRRIQLLHGASGELLADADLSPEGNLRQLCCAWSPDGQTIAVPSAEHRILLLRVTDLSPRAIFGTHDGSVRDLAFSPDGKFLAAACSDGRVRVWEIERGTEPCPPLAHNRELLTLAFSPDGARLATGGRDNTVHLFDTQRFEELVPLTGHADYIYQLSWSPDGETLLSASGDTTIGVWSTRPRRDAAPSTAAERPASRALWGE
jgi:WD40 repeat protein